MWLQRQNSRPAGAFLSLSLIHICQALFLRDGKRVVFAKRGAGFEQREVKVQSESESRAAIEGLNAGTEVALIDPTTPRRAGDSAAASPGIGGGTP